MREDSSSASATDALGSVRLTLDDNGTAYRGATYDPWGSPERGSVGTFGFTGELQQGDNVYLRARWYNAANGTFTSKDPFEGYSQQPYSLHPYQYAYSNPMLWTDPSGRDPWWYDDPYRDTTAHPSGHDTYTKERNYRCGEYNYYETINGRIPGHCDANVLFEYPHETLDVVGTIPVLGEPADALNAAIYCLEGDWTSAGLSAAAMVPFWGWGATSIKWGIRVADVARGLKTAGKYTDLDPFEKLVAQYISERGDALLGIGDDAVKKVLGLPRGNNKPKAADFLSITPSGKFNITEVKGSFAGYVDVSTARKQLTLVVGKLKSIVPGAKIGTIELAIPKNAKLDPPYEVFGNQLLLVTEEGKEVIRIDGHPVIVVEVP